MAQLFVISTAYGAIAAAAAIDAGLVPTDGGDRVLIVVNGAPVPELSPVYAESAHMQGVLARFDRVEHLADIINPILPIAWEPRGQDAPILERLLRVAWRLGSEPVALFVQSPQVAPATSLAAIFPGSPICVLGDGLMTYGPLRSRMPWMTAARVTEVHYVDVVPGVVPVLFSDVGAVTTPVTPRSFRTVLDQVAEAAEDLELDALADQDVPTVVVLGQYLAALELVTAEEEDHMQRKMVREAVALGAERVVFKAHPSAPPATIAGPRAVARELGVDFVQYRGSLPAEVIAMRGHVVGAVAGFSTALPTLASTLDLPTRAVGNDVLLHRLDPYENSNRVPVTLVDALNRPRSPYDEGSALQGLLNAVAYCMQPIQMAHLKEQAAEFIAQAPASERRRYFDPGILTSSGLPGGAPVPLSRALLDLAAGPQRSQDLRDTYRAGVRRLGRAWRAFGA